MPPLRLAHDRHVRPRRLALPLLALPLFAVAAPQDREALAHAGSGSASAALEICYNYGCLSRSEVVFSNGEMARVRELLDSATNAVQERALLGRVVGLMLGWAGERSPIAADRGGNLADEAVHGKMDCIDHSTTTTGLLRLLAEQGWLRFHRVLDPVKRTRGLIFDHFSAQIEEIAPGETTGFAAQAEATTDALSRRWVVDSWFVDNGQPAPVLALINWQSGEDPDDDRREY